jgi:hypothetical protein
MAVSPLWRSALFYFWMLGFVICSSGLGAKNRDQSIGMRRIVTQVADVDVGVRVFTRRFSTPRLPALALGCCPWRKTPG